MMKIQLQQRDGEQSGCRKTGRAGATNTATVTVNATATSRKGDYYRAELNSDNSVDSVYLSVTNVAVLAVGTNDMVTNWTGHLFLPKTPEVFGYDLDGNLTLTRLTGTITI